MNTGDNEVADWAGFVDELAAIARVAPEEITPNIRLVEDLGLDSLALTEVIVMVVETYNPASFRTLDDRVWEGMTAGQLYDECATLRTDR